MDTKHLITFITFSEEKSYLKASMKLNYASSTLAEHIALLEHELGIKLVESKGKRTVLTRAGTQFLVYARKMMDIYKTAYQDMQSLNAVKGNLRVMTVESLGLYSMTNVFAKFMSQYTEVTLSISIGNSNSVYEKLCHDEIDMAYVYDLKPIQCKDINTTVLFKEPLCYIVSPDHMLASKNKVQPKDFNHEVFIHAQKECYYYKCFTKMLEEHQVHLRKTMEVDSGNLIKKYVQAGYGICLLPYSVVKEEIENGTLVVIDWAGEQWDAYAQVVSLNKDWIMPSITALTHMSKEIISAPSR